MAQIDVIIETLENEFGQKLKITSKQRTIDAQAGAMLSAFKGNITTNYAGKKQDLYKEIKAAYELHQHETDPVVKQAIAKVIRHQVEKDKRYISWHFFDSARDISIHDMDDNGDALVSIIKKHPELQLVDERNNTREPHIHVHIKP